MKDDTAKWTMIVLILAIMAMAVYASVVAGQRKDEIKKLKAQNQALVVQNVQTKQQAYRDGILACQSEDVTYLLGLADEVENRTLSTMFLRLATGWEYDEETLDKMVDTYMNGDTTYE